MRAITVTPEGVRKVIEYSAQDEYGAIKQFIQETIDVVRMPNIGVDMYIHDEGKYTRSEEQNYLGTLMYLIDRGMPTVGIDCIYGPIIVVGPPDAEGYSTDIPDNILDQIMSIDHGVEVVDCNGKPITGNQMLGEVEIPANDEGDRIVGVTIKEIPAAELTTE